MVHLVLNGFGHLIDTQGYRVVFSAWLASAFRCCRADAFPFSRSLCFAYGSFLIARSNRTSSGEPSGRLLIKKGADLCGIGSMVESIMLCSSKPCK